MLGHQAASKAPFKSRLTSTRTHPAFNPSSTKPFTAIAASVELFCLVNLYRLLFIKSVE